MINKKLLKAFLQGSTKEQLIKGLEEVIACFEAREYDAGKYIDNLINVISGDEPTIDKRLVLDILANNPTILVYEDEKLDVNSLRITYFNKITGQVTVNYKKVDGTYNSTSVLDVDYILEKGKKAETES
jgi:hypothetical protein